MSVINTNVSALRSTSALALNSLSMQTSMQRLSTGLRINSASDDAAGLAIAQKMSAQIRGIDQAVRNANDGISLLQTAEGDMGAVGAALQRMRELAVQGANGTNSTTDAASLQTEFSAMIEEIDRVANNSQFNNLSIGGGNFKFQIGANNTNNDSISIAISKFNATTLGVDANSVAVQSGYGGNGLTMADMSAAVTGGTGYTDGVYSDVKLTGGSGSGAKATIVVASGAVSSVIITDTGTGYADKDVLGVSTVNEPLGSGGSGFELAVATADLTAATTNAAGAAIDKIDAAIQSISTARAEMGATQNRLAKTVEALQTTSTNMSAARSRIQDTDYAKETTNLARTQIIQQAGTAMLAQANQAPQTVLALLK